MKPDNTNLVSAADIFRMADVCKGNDHLKIAIKRLPIAGYATKKIKERPVPLYRKDDALALVDSIQPFALCRALAYLRRPYNDNTNEEPDMDNADLADRHTETLAKANAHRSKKPEPEGAPNGHCWHCGEPVPPDRRWCNADCRDDWQAENQ